MEINNAISDYVKRDIAIIEKIPFGFGVFYLYPNNTIKLMYLNDNYYSSINDTRENRSKYLGESFVRAIHPDDAASVIKSVYKISNDDKQYSADFRVIDKDSVYKWLNVKVCYAFTKDDIKVIYAYFMDIDKEKNLKISLENIDKILKIANKENNITVWLYNITQNYIVFGFNDDGINAAETKIYNPPFSLIETNSVYKDDQKILVDLYKNIKSGEKKSECNIRIFNPEKRKYTWYHLILSRIKDNDTDQIAYGISMDIDSQYQIRMQYRRELKLRQELFKKAIIYYEVNITKRVIEKYKNKVDDDISIAPNSDFTEEMEMDTFRKVYKEDLERVNGTLFVEALQKEYNKGKSQIECVYRRVMKHGRIHWVKATVSILKRYGNEELMAYIYIHDINDEYIDNLAINNIVDEEIRTIGIVNVASGEAHMLRDRGKIFNIEDSKHFEYDKYIKALIKERIPKKEIEKCEKFFELKNLVKLLDNEKKASISFQACHDDGILLRKSILAMYLDESHNYIAISMRDTTKLYEEEQKKKRLLENAANEAIKANNAKSDFISRISHDMRTPLNAVIGLISLAKEEKNAAELANLLECIDDSSHFLLGLINDILDLNRIESGKIVFHEEPFSYADFTRNINTVIRPLMEKKNINFIYDVSLDTENIYVDRLRFCQVFFNLLSNAAKFTPDNGTISFTVEIIPPDNKGRNGMRYHVKDNGIGMSKEFQIKMFEPFTQENSDSKVRGSGLGLSIVKRLVDAMGGKISCISEKGVGTEFIVDLYAFFENDIIKDKKEVEDDFSKLNGLHVLLVDDNEINIVVAEKILENKHCIVETAENGKQGVDKFSESQLNYYDVILMDIRMPVMNGLEATSKIRELNRLDAKNIPIIALTADAFIDNNNEVVRSKMNGYIIKPLEPKKLFRTILSVL